jgi:AbrB family looped-hinge helix DNA binding protein
MPLVKITRSRQVTIPKELFETLNLQQGDYIEVTQEGDALLLRPKVVLDRDRNQAKAQLFKMLDRVWARNKDVDPKLIEKEIAQALKEVRQRKRSKQVA